MNNLVHNLVALIVPEQHQADVDYNEIETQCCSLLKEFNSDNWVYTYFARQETKYHDRQDIINKIANNLNTKMYFLIWAKERRQLLYDLLYLDDIPDAATCKLVFSFFAKYLYDDYLLYKKEVLLLSYSVNTQVYEKCQREYNSP